MTTFTVHTPETAPEGSKQILTGVKSGLGFVPNLLATMAEAPVLLEGYTTLASILDKSDLSETERQIVLLTNNRLNGCTYCMAAHTTLSQMGGVDDAVIEALRTFAAVMNESRGWPEAAQLEAFFAAGYKQQHVLEVIVATSLKVMSNYTNHIAETELDDAFAKNVWSESDITA